MKSHGELIDVLTRSAMVQTYGRAFSEATGMPMALHGVDAWKLPFRGNRMENAFCALMAEKGSTCAACLQLQARLGQEALNGPATRTCAYGLCEMAVPVKLGRQTIGFLHTGQVMCQKPTGASFRRAVKRAGKRGVDIDDAPTRRAFFATPVVSLKRLVSLSKLLSIFADHLAMKSNQLMVATVNGEPPNITKAKQFIFEHCTESLSLKQVSSTVHMSSFYFCKQFHKATGLRLTEFVSRTRIEKAKHLLPNIHLRISEIAFAVGFQSLGHFNRTFKRIVGQSPTCYRDQVASAGMTIDDREAKAHGQARNETLDIRECAH